MLQLQNDRLMQNVAVHLHLVSVGLETESLFGQHEVLMNKLLHSDLYGHRNFVRLSPDLLRELVERVDPVIQKETTKFLEPLPPG